MRPRCTEHEDCTLAEPRELLQYAFCPADTPVARALALNAPALTEFFWDFDGTLMDTYPGMVACFVRAAERARHCGGTGTGADADEGQPRRVCASLRGGG